MNRSILANTGVVPMPFDDARAALPPRWASAARAGSVIMSKRSEEALLDEERSQPPFPDAHAG
ncbi:hypothetical protein DP43_5586 [Burkholderia pseudomallei]|nr:hypothetical protein DP43_5586 [Burkholderia pseudomallei]